MYRVVSTWVAVRPVEIRCYVTYMQQPPSVRFPSIAQPLLNLPYNAVANRGLQNWLAGSSNTSGAGYIGTEVTCPFMWPLTINQSPSSSSCITKHIWCKQVHVYRYYIRDYKPNTDYGCERMDWTVFQHNISHLATDQFTIKKVLYIPLYKTRPDFSPVRGSCRSQPVNRQKHCIRRTSIFKPGFPSKPVAVNILSKVLFSISCHELVKNSQ